MKVKRNVRRKQQLVLAKFVFEVGKAFLLYNAAKVRAYKVSAIKKVKIGIKYC